MAAQAKDSSTDRLLELIRGKGEGGAPPEAPGGKPAKGKAARAASGGGRQPKAKSPGGRGAKVVGVDIGADGIRMSKVTHSGGRLKLNDFKKVMYGPDMGPGSPGFSGFLRQTLRQFGGASASVEVWSHISTAKTELWHIRIPKVPRNQIVEAVFWSVKKEKQFDDKEFALDFEVQGEIQDKGVNKLSVMVYLVPRKELDEMQLLFSEAGIKLSGLTVSPIGVQTMFRAQWAPAGAASYAHLFVGRNWSRIDIFIGGDLVLSRGIKAGSNSMIEALMDNYNLQSGQGGKSPASPSGGDDVISLSLEDESAAKPSGNPVMDFDQARGVLWGKLLGVRGGESGPGSELSEIDTLKMIRPAAERLIRQVERTFEYHTTTMGNERVEKIFFSGELATNQLLIKYIHSQLGIECQVLDALSPSSPNVPKAATQLAPVDRLSYNLAVALALSDNTYTPNLLYTFRDKEKLRQAKKMDSAIYVVSSIILVVLACVWFWQKTVVDKKQAELDGLQAEIDTYVEPDPGATALYLEVDAEGDGVPDPGFSSRFAVTKTMLDVKASRLSALRDQWKSAAKRYEGLAILSEIKSKVEARPSVRLTSISINLGVQRDDFESSGARTVTLEGFISGDERLFELEFTSFQIEIENSPLFQLPYIISQEVERHPTVGRVLKFVIHFELQAG